MSENTQRQFKVLRLFDGANTNEDWHPRSIGYTKEEIANIPDPAASSRKEITSIPSPFARVHLFENAFLSVSNQANKDGLKTLNDSTAYHQLVSDALDVAEIFFNFEIFNQTTNNLRFVTWKKDIEIARLKSNPDHRLLGETLELYLNQDDNKTKFSEIDNFYLLFCNNVLVGGTSPSTLFFSAYNEKFRLRSLGLGKGEDVFFDEEPCPVYKRSKTLLRYFYGLFKTEPRLKTIMAPFWKYLDVNLKALQLERTEEWKEIQDTIINNFEYNKQIFEKEFKAAVTGEENTFIDIIRNISHRRIQGGVNDYGDSDFAIKSDKYNKGRKPLALQNNFAKALDYCGGRWKPDIQVPYFDPNELDKRILPSVTEVYPYLTVSDFLEPHILRVTYPIENEFFFNGNPEGFRVSDLTQGEGIPGEDSFLLPLTKRFFEFFDPEYLRQTTPDGKPVFRMIKIGTDSLEVQLLVPIKSGDFILFKRLYRPNQIADSLKNEGAVTICRFDLGFLPLFHFDKNVKQIVTLTDGDTLPTTRHFDYSLEFYTSDLKNVPASAKRSRQDKIKHQQFVTSKYYTLDNYYDFIQVSNGQNHGVIIPKWQEKSKGNKKANIAIDFGTTNSFVAVALEGEQPQPLEITGKERFLITLSESWVKPIPNQLKEVILRSLLPFTLGKGQECFLPMRTIISEIQGINHSQAVTGTDISIPFFFERRLLLLNEETITNLKWLKLSEASGDANMVRVEAYIGMLLFLARNYVLNKGATLENIKLTWLYPSSMSEQSKNIFGRTWDRLAKNYLGDTVKVERHSEAIAPFYAFGKHIEKSGDKPVLNIDIGGGTSDVVILHESKPVYSTSFRFAGNTVFGNGYAESNMRNNGLVRLLKDDINQWFDNNSGKIFNLNDAYRGDTGISKMGSADINSLFFSIETNREVATSGVKAISYANMLSDREDVKVGFLFFFASIVYHLAKLMKELDLPMPRQLAFSGKGAGIIALLDAHPQRKNAAGLAQIIFQKIYDVKQYHPEGLEILMGESPKESTCYGAINLVRDNINIEEPPTAILLNRDNVFINERNKSGEEVRYKNLDEQLLNSIEEEIKTYIDFFFQLNQEFSFSAKFGALTGDKLTKCKGVLGADLKNNLKVGLAERKKSVDSDDHVNEPLFFYPLIGSIYQLFSHFADEASKPKSV
jgi:hypothetical protein